MNSFAPLAAIVILACSFLAPGAQAKAYFAPEGVMLQRADFIAIVEITKVEKTEKKTEGFDYSEVAQARVVQRIRGELPDNLQLHGGENFICAQVHFQPGRFLVFLKLENGLFTGCNWHLSVRPIQGEQVEWYAKPEGIELSWQPLEAVLERVRQSAKVQK